MNKSKYIIKDINKSYKVDLEDHVVLNNINLEISSEDVTVILGESGCGKTTLIRIIAELETQSSGEVTFFKNGEISKAKVGMVFQESRLMPWLTVSENIAFHKKASLDKIDFYLDMMKLKKFNKLYPHELSGGMAQRVSIARALSFEPDFLIMDEPFSALDYFTRRDMQKEVLSIHKNTGKGIIFVTHDIDEAINIASRIIIFTKDKEIKEITINKDFNSSCKFDIKNQILETMSLNK